MNSKNSFKQKVDDLRDLLLTIAQIGRKNTQKLDLNDILPFQNYFNSDGNLIKEKLDEIDGLWTRREILTRYLLISSVLDQGPDLEGVRQLLKDVVHALYQKEIRILHKPICFFQELGISIDEILEKHNSIRNLRAQNWAQINNTNPNRYNLFTDKTKQVLGFAIYRWGVPLCVPLLLEKDLLKKNELNSEPLVNYLEKFKSAEETSRELKDNERYGLGKAIGDKAGHLFAKYYIYTFGLSKRKDIAFGKLSYELPFDSNAGRVLFRTGFFTKVATFDDLLKWNVIQKGKGKGGKNYIRVTEIRGKKSDEFSNNSEIMNRYYEVMKEHLKLVKARKPQKIEVQHIPNVLLLDTGFGIGELDDGLIYIGTKFCFNHENPDCNFCPIKDKCLGYNSKKELIKNYVT